mmetsp:Transcript_13411/g.31185  ORF Transcript_13411/g.31185 Transcript_13411/m.31185 type:complete len:207 (+) Transcript_13411:193-813(+)
MRPLGLWIRWLQPLGVDDRTLQFSMCCHAIRVWVPHTVHARRQNPRKRLVRCPGPHDGTKELRDPLYCQRHNRQIEEVDEAGYPCSRRGFEEDKGMRKLVLCRPYRIPVPVPTTVTRNQPKKSRYSRQVNRPRVLKMRMIWMKVNWMDWALALSDLRMCGDGVSNKRTKKRLPCRTHMKRPGYRLPRALAKCGWCASRDASTLLVQ